MNGISTLGSYEIINHSVDKGLEPFLNKQTEIMNNAENEKINSSFNDPLCGQILSIDEILNKYCCGLMENDDQDIKTDLRDNVGPFTFGDLYKQNSKIKLKVKDIPSSEMSKDACSEDPPTQSKKFGNSMQNSHASHNNSIINNLTQPPYSSMINYNNSNNNKMPYSQNGPYCNNTYYYLQPFHNYCTEIQNYKDMLPIKYNNYCYESLFPSAQSLSIYPSQQFQYHNFSSCASKTPNDQTLETFLDIDLANKKVNQFLARNGSKSTTDFNNLTSRASTSQNNNFSIKLIIEKDKLADYINSLKGSKRLQLLLKNVQHSHPDVVDLFDHIFPFLGKISNHNFGNYFVQALFQKIPLSSRKYAWSFYNRRNIMDYATHRFGYHSIQALIEAAVGNAEEKFVIGQLEKNFGNLAFNANGRCILSKVLSKFQLESCGSLCNYIRSHFKLLSCCEQTLNLAKKFVKVLAVSTSSHFKIEFLGTISEKTLSNLINDKYGSQVILLMLCEWDNSSSQIIIDIIAGRINHWMIGKFSQGIVSKCLNISAKKVS